MEPLPNSSITRLFGLIELIREKPGRYDVFRLGQELHYELDDLLPITDAAKLCGFVRIDAGDMELSPLGVEIAGAEEDRRKAVFRERIENHRLIAHIRQRLTNPRKKAISRERILEWLRKHMH